MNFDKLLKLSADLICTIDAHGKFVDVSEAANSILGYSPEEMYAKSYKDFIHPGDLVDAGQVIQDIMVGKPKIRFQNRYVHKDGRVIPILWSVHWDKEDKLMYCIARNGQVTKQAEAMRKSLKESNRRYQYVTKATSDAIWDWDLESGTLYWGDGFETIFGYNLKENPAGVNSWTDHIHPEDAKTVLDSIYGIIKGDGTNWKQEYRYKKADGTFADVVDRGFVIRNKANKAIRMVGAMHDISERKKALKEMKHVTEDLYKRNRELHEFGYIVSHNLRSPVANIMGIATLLEMETDDPETVAHCVKDLKVSIFRLDDVIKDLSKILSSTDSSVDLLTEPLNLSEIIGNVQTDLAEKIAQTNTRIEVNGGTSPICSHKAYIYSIFFNLISNAIKYRSAKAPLIKIDIVHDAAAVAIKVSDNGIGIDLNRHGHELFKPYKRFHSHLEGKGLGLFLVKSHVEALGGQITVVSEQGEGTTFNIWLPQNDK